MDARALSSGGRLYCRQAGWNLRINEAAHRLVNLVEVLAYLVVSWLTFPDPAGLIVRRCHYMLIGQNIELNPNSSIYNILRTNYRVGGRYCRFVDCHHSVVFLIATARNCDAALGLTPFHSALGEVSDHDQSKAQQDLPSHSCNVSSLSSGRVGQGF